MSGINSPWAQKSYSKENKGDPSVYFQKHIISNNVNSKWSIEFLNLRCAYILHNYIALKTDAHISSKYVQQWLISTLHICSYYINLLLKCKTIKYSKFSGQQCCELGLLQSTHCKVTSHIKKNAKVSPCREKFMMRFQIFFAFIKIVQISYFSLVPLLNRVIIFI